MGAALRQETTCLCHVDTDGRSPSYVFCCTFASLVGECVTSCRPGKELVAIKQQVPAPFKNLVKVQALILSQTTLPVFCFFFWEKVQQSIILLYRPDLDELLCLTAQKKHLRRCKDGYYIEFLKTLPLKTMSQICSTFTHPILCIFFVNQCQETQSSPSTEQRWPM